MVVIQEDAEKSRKRAQELWDKKLIDTFEVGTFKGLQDIHRYLFQDSFDFAGEVRTVNIAKGNFRFAPVLFLQDNLRIIEQMNEDTFDAIVEKYTEMNIAHAFREGNGRATRIWLDCMLRKRLDVCVDWQQIDKEDYLSAMERSPINTLEINYLLKNALTEEINNREVYMKGIDKSYEYEGYYILKEK